MNQCPSLYPDHILLRKTGVQLAPDLRGGHSTFLCASRESLYDERKETFLSVCYGGCGHQVKVTDWTHSDAYTNNKILDFSPLSFLNKPGLTHNL